MKGLFLAAGLTLALAAPALAGNCPNHMKNIDEAMAKNTSLSADKKAEAQKHRKEGEDLHKAGKHQESMAELAKAEQILGVKK